MKKLLVVALLAISFVGMSEARRCCKKKMSCETKCETPCVKKSVCCIPAPCIVGCENTRNEGCMPDICGVVPARVDVIKHVHTDVSYSCAGNDCAAPATPEQVEFFRSIGSVPEGCTNGNF